MLLAGVNLNIDASDINGQKLFTVDENGVMIKGANLTIDGGLSDDQIQSATNWNNAESNAKSYVDTQLANNVNPKLTKITSNGVYTGEVQTNQLIAGTIDTNVINLSSSDGKLKIVADAIELSHSNGSKTRIDASSFRVYPNENVSSNYIGFDGSGLFRYYDGTTSRYRDAISTGVIEANVSGESYASEDYDITTHTIPITTFDLIGPEWMNKASNTKVSVFVSDYDNTSPYYSSYDKIYTRARLNSVVNITGGIRILVEAGALWYKYQSDPSAMFVKPENLRFGFIAMG